MKITVEHAAQLTAAYHIGAKLVQPLEAYRACSELIPRIHLAKDRDMRHRWDALNASRSVVPLADLTRAIYQYANDDHIDTVLRQAQRAGLVD